MTNLLSYGVYIPRFRIEDTTLHPSRGRVGQSRPVIFADEDTLTLAFAAGQACLRKAPEDAAAAKRTDCIDAVIFATTTPVFQDRYHASFLAELLELRQGILALDLTASPRAGTDALVLAHGLISSSQARNVLVLAAEADFPPVGEELARSPRTGHAACALLLGSEAGIAAVQSAKSHSAFVAEEFVYKGSPVRIDSRFGRDAGLKASVGHALDDFLAEGSGQPPDFDAVILNSLYARSAVGAFARRGFDAEKQFFKDVLVRRAGFTGACHALLLLIDAVEKNAGRTLLVDYFNGANVFEVHPTDGFKPVAPTLAEQLSGGRMLASYQDYLVLRHASLTGPEAGETSEIFSSDMMLEREKASIFHLKGFKCSGCGSVYFLKTQRCKQCKNDTFEPVKLSRRGKIFTFTREHYFPSAFAPVTMAVVDLQGGGRLTLQVTDEIGPRESDEALFGAEVTVVLRKMMARDPKPNYFWKCVLHDASGSE